MLYSVDPDEPIVPHRLAPGTLLAEEKYPNISFKSLTDIIKVFLEQDCGVPGAQPSVAVLALAGIVMNNQCRFTNLDWVVSGNEIASQFNIVRVEVVNDFVAQGYGMLTLAEDEVKRVNSAVPQEGAPIACIGAGTGLGQCFLIADPATGQYQCYPSEGGHGEFGPRGGGSEDLEVNLLKYLKIKFSGWNRISLERIVSGTGICNVYDYLAWTYPSQVDPEVQRAHQQAPKDAGVIAQSARPGSLCERALKIFASCYGAACGNMALFVQPFGGLYLTGGVTKRMADWLLEEGSFMAAYCDKGRLASLLERVPLLIVKSDDMGQRGAHLRAVMVLQTEIEAAARRLFERLDVRRRGMLDCGDIAKIIDDEKLAGRLLTVLEVDSTGKVDWRTFRKGFTKLPVNLIVELSASQHKLAGLAKDDLVAPTIRGTDSDSQAHLAEIIHRFNLRSRRKYIDPLEDKNSAVFKTEVWKLKHEGHRPNGEDWLKRDYWINKEGDICFHSVTENRAMMYCSKADLHSATIEEADVGEDSAQRWVFRLHPRDKDGSELKATEFGVPTREGMRYWIAQLKKVSEQAKQEC